SIDRGNTELTRASSAPQVIVANAASVDMVGRLGRRVAYLPTDGQSPAPPELVRLGQHLLFLHRYSRTAGQQLIVSLTDFLTQHWVTPQSEFEKQSLAAFNAYIAPPDGKIGFYAAMENERDPLGPVPAADDDVTLEPLIDQFNLRRAKS